MSNSDQQAARAFAYGGTTLFIGVVIFFLTQGIIPFVALPDIAGAVFATGFFLVFLNISFGLGRRFCSRTFEMEHFPYILGLLVVAPTLLLTFLTERFLSVSAMLMFFILILAASMGGAFLGIRSGRRKRDKLIREALESGATPDEN